ncbi:ubiquinone/menaquinone biosynthesis C-methylase UbiE [Cerasibacillus quisquiliarum]|uniref:Methyltransferase n=1 Tax=Cerasibacillus quisquiliarum TaxID=227865 RepID=A0A511UWS0_9BACI|nr:class I SAM-dependent methyltransferase [Cerasibacillus quisquiliarum]MBB5145565.1 ubiquinone/menaquinone biosynthesis C-methylase UbiE [Cerasibacillus quisquiliarum]GEN31039.1 methyltransferase [Cerasibacillus quisquiliarum]
MIYQNLAYFYDSFMSDAPYDLWVDFTKQITKKVGKVNKIIDLGCGTGEISLRLAREGYQLIGVDLSHDMLAVAQQKASQAQLQIHWVHQDIRALEGFNDIDMIVSYCDVINYLTTAEDVRLVFKHVHKSLRKGGLFIFDIHSLYHVNNNLINHTFAYVDDKMSYIWHCSPGEEKGEMYHDLTFFIQDEDKQYTRYDEMHHQRTLSIEHYQQLLKQTGFKIKNIYSDFSIENKFSEVEAKRIFIIAEKRSD